MHTSDKRNHPSGPDIEPELLEEALHQLEAEIRLLEEWLAELDKSENSADPKIRASRFTYEDKLRSRREMRDALRISQKNHHKH